MSTQDYSCVRLFVTPWTTAHQSSLSFTISQSLFKLISIDVIQPSHPLSSPSPLPSIFPSIRVFSSALALLIRWSKYWSFSFRISPSDEDSRLISFRIDWFALGNSQKSSSAPQFESISSSLLSLLGRNISSRRAFPQEVTLIVGQIVHMREKLNRT